MNEKDKINKALDAFTEEVRKRLHWKAENELFRGWDVKSKIKNSAIAWMMFDIVVRVVQNPKMYAKRWCVDIAAFAMFLWYRH